MAPRLLSNAIANYAGQAAVALVAFAITPALLSHLGVEMYGVLMLVGAVQGLGGLFDLGIATSVVKYVAEHRARDDIDEINRVVSTSFFLHLGVGVLAFASIIGLAHFGLPLFELGGAEETARAALILAGVSLMISLPMGVLSSVLIGLRHYEITNAVIVVQTLAAAAVTLLALQLGAGIIELMLINTVSLGLAYAVRGWFAFRRLPGLRVSRVLANRASLRRISSYSIWLFMLDTAKRIFYNADAVLIALVLPVANVTAYNLGFKPASALTYLSGPFASVLLPTASHLEALGERQQLQRVLVAGTRIAVAVTLPALMWLVLFGSQVLHVWVGPGHEEALPVLYIFCMVFLVSITQNPASMVLRGAGRVKALALVVMGEYAVNFALTLLLLPLVGVIGAALGTLIPAVVVDAIVIPTLACRSLGMSYSAFARGSFVGPLLALFLAALLFWPVRLWLATPSLVNLLLSGALAVLFFGVAYLLVGATSEERARLSLLLSNLQSRAGRRHAPR
jgi:O-antigen/teichoic acid export membrane protein